MNVPAASIGAAIDDIDTPALIVDLDAFESNLNAMATFAKTAGVRLRPHAKTHKSPTVAQKQVAAGAVGQCCQKVGEAEALVRGGIRDVLVSNQIVGAQKLRRLAALAKDARIGLCFDNAEQVEAASRAAVELGVELDGLVEIEIGMQRCGTAPGRSAADLARRIEDAPNLAFRGLQAYHGSAQHLPTLAERKRAVDGAAAAVRETVTALREAGLGCEIISGAGTGTYRMEGMSGLWNELQAGSYLFMDTDYARIGDADGGHYSDFRHSLFVLSTVMSVPSGDRAIVDAGLKSYSGEKGSPWVWGKPDVTLTAMSDEHGKLMLGANAPRLRLGDKVMLIPGHCDPTINLHDEYVAIRNGRVEALWPIAARGASR
jgi:D-serine deaminase-like pyridoxal phosphate-dependent protein